MPIQNYRIRGQDLHVHQSGDQGTVILLVHGFPLNHAQWHPQLQHFASPFRLIAPDLRGMGGSAITDEHATITMDQHADDLAALLDHFKLHEPVVFVGLSMGGYVGWQFAKRHPQRLRGLVLCHTRIIADTPTAAAGRHNLAAQLLKERSTKPAEDAFIPKLLAPNAPATLIEKVQQMARSSAPAGLAANLRGLAVREDATAILPSIRVPTQIISGEYDAISPPDEMKAWATKIAQARFTIIPGVGHLSPLEAPAVFNQCLAEFLSWCAGKTNP
jgi:pimeloyl-ACP methyl ester carboxylesterase